MKKREIKTVKIGDRVIVSDKMKKFYAKEAYEFNVICNTDKMTKSGSESFFSWLLLGRGYPYKAKVVDYLSSVGDGPGFRISLTFPCGQKYATIVGYKDLKRVRK